MGDGLALGPDGVARCAWAGSAPEYLAYHDEEWGVPVRGEAALFERLSLEAFQSGLSWLTILRKRPAFREAFDGFDPELVAGYGPRDVARLMTDERLVRNRRKIEATIGNAEQVVRLRDDGGLDALLWSFAPSGPQRSPRAQDISSRTPASTALAGALRSRGLRFVGPTTAYATMQACGLVNDHVRGCHRAAPPAPQ